VLLTPGAARLGGHCQPGTVHVGDLTVMSEVAGVVASFVAAHGSIDILVHCALDRSLGLGRAGAISTGTVFVLRVCVRAVGAS
jgi:NAD(P)-dependent dehydrogenase (short-subunit alcohol dehydrogenase family)